MRLPSPVTPTASLDPEYMNVTLGFCCRTSRENIECQWINGNNVVNDKDPSLQSHCIPSDLITNFTIPQSSVTSIPGSSSQIIDDSNIFLLNHRKPVFQTCHISVLHAYKANANNEWDNMLALKESGEVLTGPIDLLIQKRTIAEQKDFQPKQTTIQMEIHVQQELKFQFELDEHNDYSVQEEPSEENNYEAFISFFTARNESIGLVIPEAQEQQFRQWIQTNIRANSCAEDLGADGELSQLHDDDLPPSQFLHGLSIIRSKREGSQIILRALVIITEHPFVYAFKSLLRYALSLILSNEGIEDSPQSILTELYEILSAFCVSDIPRLTPLQQKIYRWTLLDYDTITYKTKVEFRGKMFKLKIPLSRDADEINDEQVSLVKFVSKFREETMTIFNAILQERNVLFFGNGGDKQSISSICYHVLTACLLVTPTLSNVLEYRVFPYNTMQQVDQFTSCRGYIAGMKHPDCKYKLNWDILCDLSSGKVITNPASPYYAQLDNKKPYEVMDHGFASSMLSLIDSYALKGHKLESLEMSIRTHFQDYARRLTNMACGTLEYEDEQKKHHALKLNDERVKTWKFTQSYLLFRNSLLYQQEFIKNINVEQMVHKLRTAEYLTTNQLAEMLTQFLLEIDTEEKVLEFITHFPDPQGGLYPLGVLLLHTDESIRQMVVILIARIDEVPEGSACISYLNTFLMLSFDRLKAEMQKEGKMSQ